MAYTFDIPPNLRALYEAGQLVRKGALLINSKSGGIVAHLQETGGMASLLEFLPLVKTINSGSSIVAAVTGVVGVVQNEQIKRRIDTMQKMLESMQGMQLAGLLASVASLGVSAAGTALILRRFDGLRGDLVGVKDEVASFRVEWSAEELEKLIGRAQHKVERAQSARSRRDAKPLLHDADVVLDEVFDMMHRRVELIFRQDRIPTTALALLFDGMAMASAAHFKTLFLLEEPEAAKDLAQRQFRKFADLTIMMPADKLVGRLGQGSEAADQAQQFVRAISEARMRIASLPPLVDQLARQKISTARFIEAAEAEMDAPLLFLEAK